MLPSELTPGSFARYPPKGRSLAIANIALFQQLPLLLIALLLQQLIGYDWRFPEEQRMIDDQFSYLRGLPSVPRDENLRGFAAVKLSPQLEAMNWIGSPQLFIEAFTAHLWSTHQIGMFQNSASSYVDAWRKAIPEPPPKIQRVCIVVLDRSLASPGAILFRKLRPHGVFFPAIDPANAWPEAVTFANSRVVDHPVAYAHWYIDGGSLDPLAHARLTRISWNDLELMRAGILSRFRKVVESGSGGPEQAEAVLSEITPRDLGFDAGDRDEVLTRFEVSVLTEGSGTQIFSTTFVQWAARETLRRAQPSTLLMRYMPRQRQRPMNELIEGTGDGSAVDPEGSLIDADIGAYYTWINQQRLTGADRSAFVVWSEAHNQALAIGPGMSKATVSSSFPTMNQLLKFLLA